MFFPPEFAQMLTGLSLILFGMRACVVTSILLQGVVGLTVSSHRGGARMWQR
jgi:hypothetical protein